MMQEASTDQQQKFEHQRVISQINNGRGYLFATPIVNALKHGVDNTVIESNFSSLHYASTKTNYSF